MTAPRILTCPGCGTRHRADQLPGRFTCYRCGAVLETMRLLDRFVAKGSRWYIAPDGSATRLK